MAVGQMMDDLPYGPILVTRVQLRVIHSADELAQLSRQLLDLANQLQPTTRGNRELGNIRANWKFRRGHAMQRHGFDVW
jgi:hypothetical protein